MQPLRESPNNNSGIVTGLKRGFLAFKNSTQVMTPTDAITELNKTNFSPYFEWFDRVNKLLSILTKVEIVIDAETNQKIGGFERLCYEWYRKQRRYPEIDFINYAHGDPREEKMDDWDVLTQLIGRCRLLQEIRLKSLEEEARLKEVQKQLRATHDEEVRLNQKLTQTSKEKGRIQEALIFEIERLKETVVLLNKRIELVNEEKSRVQHESKSLRDEIGSLNYQLKEAKWKIEDLEEALEKTKLIEIPVETPVVTEVEKHENVNNKDLISLLHKLEEDNRVLLEEREELLSINSNLQDRLRKNEEGKETQALALHESQTKLLEINSQLQRVKKAYQSQNNFEIIESLENLYNYLIN